ncbi:RICIN domain-containing protein [Lentzea sp. NPDC004789]
MGNISAAVCAAILGVAGLAVPAQAADEPVTFFKLYGSITGGRLSFPGTGKCLDAALEEIDQDGGKVQMWTCGFGGAEQQWRFEYPDESGGALVINEANGKCLDVALEEIDQEGGRLQLYQCTGGPEQRWELNPHQGDMLIRSQATTGYLGVPSVYDGAPVGLYGKG